MTKTYKVVVDTGYVGVDMSFEFEADEETDDMLDAGEEVLRNNLSWHIEDEDGNEVEI